MNMVDTTVGPYSGDLVHQPHRKLPHLCLTAFAALLNLEYPQNNFGEDAEKEQKQHQLYPITTYPIMPNVPYSRGGSTEPSFTYEAAAAELEPHPLGSMGFSTDLAAAAIILDKQGLAASTLGNWALQFVTDSLRSKSNSTAFALLMRDLKHLMLSRSVCDVLRYIRVLKREIYVAMRREGEHRRFRHSAKKIHRRLIGSTASSLVEGNSANYLRQFFSVRKATVRRALMGAL
jgi:hypothetical protein